MSHAVPYDHAFFDEQVAGSYRSAGNVLPLLFEFFKPVSMVDIGCGVGPWLKCAQTLGVEEVFGIDGEYVDRGRLLIEADRFQAVDLSRRFDLGRRFDLAVSVEVAEHLPCQRSETFVADLVALSDVVLFSAAIPFQGGSNHINEQWLEFWAILFRRHGFVACDILRQQLWQRPEVEFWYTQNLMVFCRRDRASELFPPEAIADGRSLSLPHPLTFLVNVARYRPFAVEVRDSECEDYLALLKAHLAGETLLPPLRVSGAFNQQSGAALFPSARTAIADVRAELEGKDHEIGRLRDALAAREEERSRVISELAASAESTRQAMALLAARQAERKRLDRELGLSRGQLVALQADFSRVTAELASQAEARERSSIELASRNQEAARLEGEIERLTGQLAARDAEIHRVTAALNGEAEQRERLAGELAASNQEAIRQDRKIERLAELLAARDAEIHRVTAALNGETEQRERLAVELAASNQEAVRLEAEIERLSEQLAERKAAIGRVTADMISQAQQGARSAVEMATRNQELCEQRSAIERHANEFRHTVEALRRSWSWRLTAPLRAVLDAVLRIQRLMRGS